MKKFIFAALLVSITCSVSYGQHSDIEFGYDDFNNPTTIIIESDELTDDGIQIVEGDFETLFGEVFADSPGFLTIATEDPGGERVNPGDEVSVRFLDASQNSATGTGYVNFFDASTGEITSDSDTPQLSIAGSGDESVVLAGDSLVSDVDIVLLSVGSDGATLSNSPEEAPEILGPGEIHNHLVFTLDQNTPGAYGLLFQFESAPANGGPTITSAPVWLILNNGLGEEVFEDEAVAAFVASVLLGDVNGDGIVNFLDIPAFIAVLTGGGFLAEADIDGSGEIDFLDIPLFVDILAEL